VIAAVVPARARAWGKLGHETVALLAQRIIEQRPDGQQIMSKIRTLIGPDSNLDAVALCADAIKRGGVDCGAFHVDQMYETSGWHYIDADVHGDPSSILNACNAPVRHLDPSQPPTPSADNCNVLQINEHLQTLKTSPDLSQRQLALMFVVHLVGDLHQPMHCVNDNDAGGNGKLVSFKGVTTDEFGPLNLHAIWDDVLYPPGEGPDAATLTNQLWPLMGEAIGTANSDMTAAAQASFTRAQAIYADLYGYGGQTPKYQSAPVCKKKGRDSVESTVDCPVLGDDYVSANQEAVAFRSIREAGAQLAFVLADAFKLAP
jgi:hypothetical protein